MDLPKAIIEWVKGNPVDTSMLVPQYGRMFAKNNYLVEVKVKGFGGSKSDVNLILVFGIVCMRHIIMHC